MKLYISVILLTVGIIADEILTATAQDTNTTTTVTTASTVTASTAATTASTAATTASTAVTTASTAATTASTAATTASTAATTASTATTTASTAATTASTAATTASTAATIASTAATNASTAATTASTAATTASTAATTASTAATNASTAATTASTVATTASTSTATAASTAISTGTTTSNSSASTQNSSAATTPSSPASTAEPSTVTSVTTTTTAQPDQNQNFTCQVNGTTKFALMGYFALSLTYMMKNNTLNTVYINVPQPKSYQSNCTSSEATEALKFDFFNGWSIEYIFAHVGAGYSQSLGVDEKYYVSNVTVTYVHDEHLPSSNTTGATSKASYESNSYLESSGGGYYSCKSTTYLDINSQVKLTTTGLKYRAFNDAGDIDLNSGSAATECPADEETSSVVPIAVGAALAGLVVIVLIAYLIGRKRSRKTGYESV